MILRDRRSTSYDLASLFRGRRNTLDKWNRKNARHIGTSEAVSSTLNFPCLKIVTSALNFPYLTRSERSLVELLRFLNTTIIIITTTTNTTTTTTKKFLVLLLLSY